MVRVVPPGEGPAGPVSIPDAATGPPSGPFARGGGTAASERGP